MNNASYAADLALALDMADAADKISMATFRSNELSIDRKPDMTHVTEADLAVEQSIRDTLGSLRPDDGIVGEEYADVESKNGRRWVIDPIDGTANYVRGNPVWGTLISLFDGNYPVMGVASAPALNRRWWASLGEGAWAGTSLENAERLEVSKVAKVEDSFLSFSSLSSWKKYGKVDEVVKLWDECWRERAYGDFYHYALLAEGAVDAAAEPEVSLWDLAAMAIIVEEAGGRFTDLKGNRGPSGGTSLATNGVLHDVLFERLKIS